MKTQLFINQFQKGQDKENANLGTGNMVGFDLYTKKGVAMLAKKSATVLDTSGTAAFPHFQCVSLLGTVAWVQLSDGQVLSSTSPFTSWTGTSFPDTGAGFGNGLIFFEGFVFAFTPTKVYYHNQNPASGSWTDWTTAKSLAANVNQAMSPIPGLHFPFLYPSSRGVYFGNGSSNGTVGFFGQVGTTAFDPTGSAGTDFLYNGAIFSLPNNTYNIGPLNFLPPSNLAIAAYAFQNPSSADLITWDTISANKFNPPLTLYSNTQGLNTQGIKQIFSRNQVLYTVSGGNHTLYETNGSTFNLVEDIALYSNVRGTNGAETNLPVFFDSYPQAIAVVGNKLLSGVSTPSDNTYLTTGLGIFPIGVWSVAFNADGSKSTQCEFIPPVGSLISPSGAGNYAKITSIQPIGSARFLIGYGVKTSGTLASGVALIDISSFITDITQTALESEMFEIGTAINPQTVNLIEINLVKNLLAGQVIDLSYRTGFDKDWTVIDTYTGDGTLNYYHLDKNPIGATQYIQLRIRANTGSPNGSDSPEIRNIILS